eukprot:12601.XXX_557946_558398_1 [CDS] Oithona nana genome sequencing.
MAGMLLTSRPRQPVPTSRQLQQLTLSSLQQQRGCSLCQPGPKLADGRRRSGGNSLRLLLCRFEEEEAGNAPSRLVFRGYSRLEGDQRDQEQLDTVTKNFNVIHGFFLGHPVRRANNVIAKKSISSSLRLLPKKRQQTSYSPRSPKSESKK